MILIRFLIIFSLCILIMGNSNCVGSSSGNRILRLSADVRPVTAQVVKLPDGRTIDFPYVANALFYYSVMLDPHFLIDRPIQIGLPPTTASSKPLLRQESDDEILARWGFGISSHFSAAMAADLPCLHYAPEIKLGANVISFELIGSGGIHGGYPGVPIGGSLQFDDTQLSVTIESDDPLTGKPIAIDAGRASEYKLSASVDYMSMIGLDFFLKTPLFTVVSSAFQTSISTLVNVHMQQLNATDWNQVWQSKIIFDPVISDGKTHLAMRGGSRANVQIGDIFAVYNMHYQWVNDQVCGTLDYAIANPANAIAEMNIVEVGEDVSVGVVNSSTADFNLQPGAIVKLRQLHKPNGE